jgi:uncharacterized membrane protein
MRNTPTRLAMPWKPKMPFEPLPAPIENGSGMERLVFFTDAVFAIAITLLVLDIRLPGSIEGASNWELWNSLVAIWPRYLAYIISFLVISGFWIGHHHRFGWIHGYNRRLILLNLLLMMAVAFIPFPTEVIAENGNRTGTVFYALSIAMVGLLSAAEWIYASHARLVDSRLTARETNIETWQILIVPGVFLASIGLAFIDPDLAKYVWLLIIPLTFLHRNFATRK